MQLHENTIFQKLLVLHMMTMIYDDNRATVTALIMNIMLIIQEFCTTHFPIKNI